jgi:hypothetical protein
MRRGVPYPFYFHIRMRIKLFFNRWKAQIMQVSKLPRLSILRSWLTS